MNLFSMKIFFIEWRYLSFISLLVAVLVSEKMYSQFLMGSNLKEKHVGAHFECELIRRNISEQSLSHLYVLILRIKITRKKNDFMVNYAKLSKSGADLGFSLWAGGGGGGVVLS